MKSYTLANCSLRIAPPVEVGRAGGHFWFSTLHAIEEQEILCEVILTADKAQGKWPSVLYLSRDGGASWSKACDIDSYGPISVPFGHRQRLLMPYELWPLTPGDKRNATADGTIITCHEDGRVATETVKVTYLNFPRDIEEYNVDELYLLTNGNILPLRDGRRFATVYGKFVGDESYSTIAVVSEDGGVTWRFLSIVAGENGISKGREGANESNTVRLPDGRLMCVYRVGGRNDYFKSYSADDGATWTKPERMEGVWSVEPRLERLDNGLILLSGGRPGLYFWVCADGRGERWERFNLAEHHNALVPETALHYDDRFCQGHEVFQPYQSTSYTGMEVVGPDEVLISYDCLGNGWGGAPGPWGETDAVWTVRVKAIP
ncbi:MAG: exo-alpha-sialidase [Candidatus Latescibacteria bacterium]|nr:exo-alpha-sialidase [Candidatus Latescibacterota bacterium]